MRSRLIAMLFALLPSFVQAGETNYFSPDEVRGNVVKFINTIFGAKPPTLANLIYFSGGESMLDLEVPLEEEVCRKKYKANPPQDWGKCWDQFVGPRHDHPQKHESLYYKLLRKKLSVKSDGLTINSIKFVNGEANNKASYFLITMDVIEPNLKQQSMFPKQLILSHVDSPSQVSESGTVSIEAVVIPIREQLDNK